ncbi:hypothetical protein AC249_AIPGENE11409 [Exaiptasia diaphana]|nr:hypothetical protein AC249_AIPGENE11409 [Exaiptasia diaphana]
MKANYYAIIIANLFIVLGSALKCHRCGSTNSLDECHGRIKDFVCPDGFDQCLKANWSAALFGDISQGYVLGCARSVMCKKQNYTYCMQTSGQISCDINCCDTDLCNAGSTMSISLGLMIMLMASGVFLV